VGKHVAGAARSRARARARAHALICPTNLAERANCAHAMPNCIINRSGVITPGGLYHFGCFVAGRGSLPALTGDIRIYRCKFILRAPSKEFNISFHSRDLNYRYSLATATGPPSVTNQETELGKRKETNGGARLVNGDEA